MNAGVWTAIILSSVALLGMLGTLLAGMHKRGVSEGKLEQILEQLKVIAGDHEARLRSLEHKRRAD